MSQPITCVLLIPATLVATANNLIKTYGFGLNNISVPITKISNTSAWLGCQIWCDQAFIDFIQEHQAIEPMSAMIVSAINGGNSYNNWQTTLATYGFTITP